MLLNAQKFLIKKELVDFNTFFIIIYLQIVTAQCFCKYNKSLITRKIVVIIRFSR